MSVKQSLLAILQQGPCYGYQLRAEFDRRTGSRWPLNVGQIYNTLERLSRDGLVRAGETDAQGHVFYELTDLGRREVEAWRGTPVVETHGSRDDLATRLVFAATLPDTDVSALVESYRVAVREALTALRAAALPEDPAEPEALVAHLLHESRIRRAEADLVWVEDLASRLDGAGRLTLPLRGEHPRRGRPPALATAGGHESL